MGLIQWSDSTLRKRLSNACDYMHIVHSSDNSDKNKRNKIISRIWSTDLLGSGLITTLSRPVRTRALFFFSRMIGTNLFFPYKPGLISFFLHGLKYSISVLRQHVWKSLSRRDQILSNTSKIWSGAKIFAKNGYYMDYKLIILMIIIYLITF